MQITCKSDYFWNSFHGSSLPSGYTQKFSTFGQRSFLTAPQSQFPPFLFLVSFSTSLLQILLASWSFSFLDHHTCSFSCWKLPFVFLFTWLPRSHPLYFSLTQGSLSFPTSPIYQVKSCSLTSTAPCDYSIVMLFTRGCEDFFTCLLLNPQVRDIRNDVNFAPCFPWAPHRGLEHNGSSLCICWREKIKVSSFTRDNLIVQTFCGYLQLYLPCTHGNLDL